jgi:hypothetical protein
LRPQEAYETEDGTPHSRTVAEAVAVFVKRLALIPSLAPRFAKTYKRDQLIRALYMSGMPQTEIAARFGISSERVSQIIRKNNQ